MNPIAVIILFLGFIAFFGLLFAGIGYYQLHRLRHYRCHGKCTLARVIRIEQIFDRSSSDRTGSARPVLQYLVEGKAYEHVRTHYSQPNQYRVGEEVPFYYLPSTPEKGAIASRQESSQAWIFAGVGTVLLVFVLVVSLLLVIFSDRPWLWRTIKQGSVVSDVAWPKST